MTYGEYPYEAFIHRLADGLSADRNGWLVPAAKIPEKIGKRVLQRPAAFSKRADLDDRKLHEVLRALDAAC
jgi:hypothetical protein